MKKEKFIEKLSKLTPEEIDKLILEKGKEGKIIPGIIFYNLKSY